MAGVAEDNVSSGLLPLDSSGYRGRDSVHAVRSWAACAVVLLTINI